MWWGGKNRKKKTMSPSPDPADAQMGTQALKKKR